VPLAPSRPDRPIRAQSLLVLRDRRLETIIGCRHALANVQCELSRSKFRAEDSIQGGKRVQELRIAVNLSWEYSFIDEFVRSASAEANVLAEIGFLAASIAVSVARPV
jgi:hypothetical protein